jgi:ATPase subunit of ABC transporter with duplicated ATPase domains
MLELQGLTRRYSDLVALDDLSFTVAEDQMFGFVGPNGAGKTTAMRIILGVLAPDAGEVRWRGQPMNDEIRKYIGYPPEDHGQTFLRECADACSRGGSTHAKRGNERDIGAPTRGHPEAPGTDYTTVGVVSLGVHGDALQSVDAARVHVELARAELLDGLGVAVTRQAAGG